jgi:Cytochrome c554 and c-prime
VRARLPSMSLRIAVIGALSLTAQTSSTYDVPLPGPAPRSSLVPIVGIGLPKDERCADCHAEIAAEWNRSLHRAAWENDYFQKAYAVEPLAFCRGCHAPLADPATEPSLEARHAGVGCTTCHVVSAGIVGVRVMAAQRDGHEVIGDARLATSAACGRCHDFAFPGSRRPDIDRMQKTMHEHAQSVHAAKPCQDCHMPVVPSRQGPPHKQHDFRVMGNREFMARAVVIKESKIENDALLLDLDLGSIGHAFPTGDLYRRVEVRATPLNDQDKPIAQDSTQVLARAFGPTLAGPDKAVPVEREDGRLTGPKRVVLPLPKGTTRAHYEIVWQRLPPEMAKKFGMNMKHQEMVVVEGIVKR